MPEGDILRRTADRFQLALTGHVVVRSDLRWPSAATVDLVGTTVLETRSYGKHLLTRFDDGRSLHSHFRMDGAWHLYRPGQKWQRPAHQVRAIIEVENRIAIGFSLHDMELVPTSAEGSLVGHLGPDLLGENWSDADLHEAARRLSADPARQLGPALLDQRVMAGVGNLYKTEVCFMLGVSPWAPVSAVDAVEAVKLSRKLLLANAWAPEQSTTGQRGRGHQHWVFERGGKPCRRCGDKIRVETQGDDYMARISYWCPTCQQ